jgi:TOBE domain
VFSLRPENIRISSGNSASFHTVKVRGRLCSRAFHGATELLRVECGGELVLEVRTPGSGKVFDDVDLEFFPEDAVLVRDSAERI